MHKMIWLSVFFYMPVVFSCESRKELQGRMIKKALEHTCMQVKAEEKPCFISFAGLLHRKVITLDFHGWNQSLYDVKNLHAHRCHAPEVTPLEMHEKYKLLFDWRIEATRNLLINSYGYKKEDLPKI